MTTEMDMDRKDIATSIKMAPEIYQMVKAEAERRGCSMNAIINYALELYASCVENDWDVQETQDVDVDAPVEDGIDVGTIEDGIDVGTAPATIEQLASL